MIQMEGLNGESFFFKLFKESLTNKVHHGTKFFYSSFEFQTQIADIGLIRLLISKQRRYFCVSIHIRTNTVTVIQIFTD